jgi:hypothetical protein
MANEKRIDRDVYALRNKVSHIESALRRKIQELTKECGLDDYNKFPGVQAIAWLDSEHGDGYGNRVAAKVVAAVPGDDVFFMHARTKMRELAHFLLALPDELQSEFNDEYSVARKQLAAGRKQLLKRHDHSRTDGTGNDGSDRRIN